MPSSTHAPIAAEPIVHARGVAAGTSVGLGLTAAVGMLWTAIAFSSRDSWAYNHLAWWLGATVIGAALIGAVAAGGLSTHRGPIAGAVNGITAAGLVVVAAGGLALLALAVNGSLDDSLIVNGHSVTVEFLRPYVAFWAAAGTMVAGVLGGAGGGLVPRRRASLPVVELASISGIGASSLGSAGATNATSAA